MNITSNKPWDDNLVAARLKNLTSTVLELYRSKNEMKLRVYADALFRGEDHKDLTAGNLFVKLVKVLHPDRLALHLKEIGKATKTGDPRALDFYRTLMSLETHAVEIQKERFDFDFSEEYGYGEEDFGYHTETYSGMEELDRQEFEEEVEFDFIHAVKAEFFGNLEYTILPADLVSMEGELDMAGYGILDTEGIQFCKNISRLNLGHNRISNLFDLKDLYYLKELLLDHNLIENIEYLERLENVEILDISFNEIEDISPLLKMERLQFVDVRGNGPVSSVVLAELHRRGVVVLR